jgi:hypothetical protein
MFQTAITLADPCDDCGDTGGHLNTGNVRPARLAAERFGFPAKSRICKGCYEKWRYRLRTRSVKSA